MFEFIKEMVREKRKYKQMKVRANALPEDYRFVFDKIQHYMWQYAAGSGLDMTGIFLDLLELFEVGAADGKRALDVTGEDVAGFCDELLHNTKTYTGSWRESLNLDIKKKLGKENNSQ